MLIKKDQDLIRSYLEDSSNLKGGYADEVVFPENIEELAAFVKESNIRKEPITISGGGTGTAGSRVPFGGSVVSMEKLNRIYDVSAERMSANVQAGVIVDDFKAACEKQGLFYASHPTEKTAFVGGTVATNASGARSFKYGPTRRYVKRLRMIMANGEVFEVRRRERFIKRNDSAFKLNSGLVIKIPLPTYRMPAVKNSAGYFAEDNTDLIDLFIGQEGTLSLITDIELGLVKKPFRIFSCFIFFENEADSWNFAKDVRAASKGMVKALSIDALAIEYFDDNALRLLKRKNPGIPKNTRAAIFVEHEMEDGKEDTFTEKWLKFISGYNVSLDDTWVAMNEKESERFNEFRHYIPDAVNEIVRQGGFQKLSTDIAVPCGKFPDMMYFYTDAFKKDNIEHVIFGHIGECHVHVNLLPKSDAELKRAKEMIASFIKMGVASGGTISAEHGVGKTKHAYLETMYGRAGILEMAMVKKAFDPNCILGLDNIFPRKVLDHV